MVYPHLNAEERSNENFVLSVPLLLSWIAAANAQDPNAMTAQVASGDLKTALQSPPQAPLLKTARNAAR
jgi:hypothetical protein